MAETLQQLADRGIQTYNGQQYQATPSGTYAPVNSGSASAGASVSNTSRPLNVLTAEQAKQQAEAAFSGIVSPMTVEDIRAREKEAQAITAKTAASVYDPQIAEKERTGMAQVSTAEGVVGQRQGFNISTAELAFVADTQSKVANTIKEVQNAKQAYLDQGNFNAANRADDQLQKLNEFNTQMTMAKANYALQLMSGSREQAQLELAQTQAKADELAKQRQLDISEIELLSKIPKGNTFTYNGKEYTGLKETEIEPLTNAELISLMKEVPYGEKQTFNLGGQEYIVSGIDRSNPNLKTIESTNNSGTVIITTYDVSKGKIVNQVSAGQIGKTGGSGTSVNVSLKTTAAGELQNKMWDKSGNEIGTYARNPQTGLFTFYNKQGQQITAPKDYTTVQPKVEDSGWD